MAQDVSTLVWTHQVLERCRPSHCHIDYSVNAGDINIKLIDGSLQVNHVFTDFLLGLSINYQKMSF